MSKKRITSIVPILSLISSVVVSIVYSPVIFAASNIQAGADAARGAGQPATLFGTAGVFTTISSLLLYIIGSLSVIMIIFGGLRYVTSGGNAATVTAAKNTVLYAIVGVVVALLAYAVVNFVLGSLAASGTGGTNV